MDQRAYPSAARAPAPRRGPPLGRAFRTRAACRAPVKFPRVSLDPTRPTGRKECEADRVLFFPIATRACDGANFSGPARRGCRVRLEATKMGPMRYADGSGQGPESNTSLDRLVHRWEGSRSDAALAAMEVVDETLRDGLQSPSVKDPSLRDKVEMIHRMAAVGIQSANIGIPSAHERQYDDALTLAREIANQRLSLAPHCAARARVSDIEPIVDLSQRVGAPIEVSMFLGSSPIRGYAEGWTLDELKRRTEDSVRFAIEHGLPVMYVTEDSTRSTPETLRQLYATALRHGATRLCIADTVGCATPAAARAIVRFVQELIDEVDAPGVSIDWHGHRDRGLDVACALAAWDAGARRCHGTVLGIGERCGNTPIELLLINLYLQGCDRFALNLLIDYVEFAAAALHVEIPAGEPIVGANAFRTATGTHAAAMLKAERKSEPGLAEHLYSCIPATLLGRRHSIDIGPMSGAANVAHYLERQGIPRSEELMKRILRGAKSSERVLRDPEIEALVDGSAAYRSNRVRR